MDRGCPAEDSLTDQVITLTLSHLTKPGNSVTLSLVAPRTLIQQPMGFRPRQTSDTQWSEGVMF